VAEDAKELPDEYDAAQDRRELAGAHEGRPRRFDVERLPNAAGIGLTRKQIHEARIIHDGERAEIVQAPEWEGPAFDTCMAAASVACRVETCRRRQPLTFSHHREVASLGADNAGAFARWRIRRQS
jgi:hypothetical protein